ncbi:HlyD family efflux transporter periplasmic adaptor subunit [Mariprofundus sp. EBB-1]|uniref:efflux RND transporter periplasmic adaptor subunit n=1 Tax=Mariprofundus sp. EBB-1 TaxID=2650971 RepID=UPI000EF1C5E1|nr:HlyD family efflux transporter periplasmic adaptor subunit [Mariprofundus sp. EBB-1]RLL51274.1 HlyD family efflux transporter periplasmic adaptor subunit [Mariprofundus sp. EBB-1]
MSGNSISYLDREVWQQLIEAETVNDFCGHWLHLQCLMIRDVQSAVVLAESEQGDAFEPVALWPDGMSEVSENLKSMAAQALESKQGVVTAATGEISAIGYPVWSCGALRAVVVMELAERSDEHLRAVLRTLQWGASWLDNFFLQQDLTQHDKANQNASPERLKQLIDLLAQTLEQKDFNHACMVLVNELSNRFDCGRVSLGFKGGKQMDVRAMSHSSQMDRKMNLVRAIAEAMDEVADQDAMIHYPHDNHYLLITQAHARLKEAYDSSAILSLPLKDGAGSVFAVLTLEQSGGAGFVDQNTVRFCEALAVLLGPILYDMKKNDSPLWKKVAESGRDQWSKLVGEDYLLRKFIVAGLLIATLFFTFVNGEYRVTGEAKIEGEMRRVIAAPYDGFIKEAYARVGDTLKQGELIVTLDDEDLHLERLKWIAKKGEFRHKYQQAQSKHDLGESRLAAAQMDQADAELGLVDERIKRTIIKAPFDGLIVDGDLSQSLGAAVQKGDVLFEITPLHDYRVKLKVDEVEITEIENGQQGQLYLTSAPGETFLLQVQRITPVSTAEDGINYFTVEASLDKPSATLRPGMEGVGKVVVGERKLFWIWTHDLLNWLRLQLWVMFDLKF